MYANISRLQAPVCRLLIRCISSPTEPYWTTARHLHRLSFPPAPPLRCHEKRRKPQVSLFRARTSVYSVLAAVPPSRVRSSPSLPAAATTARPRRHLRAPLLATTHPLVKTQRRVYAHVARETGWWDICAGTLVLVGLGCSEDDGRFNVQHAHGARPSRVPCA